MSRKKTHERALLLDALACENFKRPPVWLMRQAGRYMPQYQAIRKQHSLLTCFNDPDLATEITLLPIDLLKVDAAILFSDILIIVKAFGLQLDFIEGKGPQIHPILVTRKQIDLLPSPDLNRLKHVASTIQQLKRELTVPLIGFAGGPFTVASYMMGGLSLVKKFAYTDPKAMHELLEKILQATISYLDMQVTAGCEVLQIFDSWAGLLPLQAFEEFCVHYLQKIVQTFKEKVPVVVFTRGSSLFANHLAAIAPNCISLDWQLPMKEVRSSISKKISLQGNLDPDILRSSIPKIREETRNLLALMHRDPGFIVNLGHGVLPDTPLENVQAFVETVKEFF